MDENQAREIDQLMQIAASGDPLQAPAAMHRARTMLAAACVPQRYTGGMTRAPGMVPHSTIQMDQVHPPMGLNTVHATMAPSRILVVPNIPLVGPSSVSPGERLEFSAGGGWLIGWRGTAFDTTVGAQSAGDEIQAQAGVRMFINDGEELITNGLGADFARFSDLFPPAALWSPIMRRMDVKDILNLQFQNFAAATGEDTPSYTFSMAFLFWREKYPGMG
jgi:hypothetical protein